MHDGAPRQPLPHRGRRPLPRRLRARAPVRRRPLLRRVERERAAAALADGAELVDARGAEAAAGEPQAREARGAAKGERVGERSGRGVADEVVGQPQLALRTRRTGEGCRVARWGTASSVGRGYMAVPELRPVP